MYTVLFVCTGNTCRSPMAQAAATVFFEKHGLKYRALSCGLAAGINVPMSENAAQALREKYGREFSHLSEQISEHLLAESDIIVGISAHHAETIRELYPYSLKGKILISMPCDIPDPFGGSLEDYRRCLDMIDQGVNQLFSHLPEEQEDGDIHIELYNSDWEKQLYEIEKLSFTTPWCEEEFKNLGKNELATAFVAINGQKPIGFIIIYRVADEAQIMDLAVHPDFRRMGAAEALLDVAAEFCRMDGAGKMMLEVRVSNTAARALYEKKGFKAVGTRRSYYSSPVEDAVLYDLKL